MILSITKVGNPLRVTRQVNKPRGYKLGRKMNVNVISKVIAKDFVEPETVSREPKKLQNKLFDKIATFFISHLFRYLFREWY